MDGNSILNNNNDDNNVNSDEIQSNVQIANDEFINEIKRSATSSNNNVVNEVISSLNNNTNLPSSDFIAEQEHALLDSATNKENDLLAILFSMGFENTEDNLKALRKANNDIDQAVNFLIEEKIPYDVINDIRENDFLEETANLRRRYQELSELNNSLNQGYANNPPPSQSYQLANVSNLYRIVNPNESYIVQNYNGNGSIVIDNNEYNRMLIQQQQQNMENEPPAPEYPGYNVPNNVGNIIINPNSIATVVSNTNPNDPINNMNTTYSEINNTTPNRNSFATSNNRTSFVNNRNSMANNRASIINNRNSYAVNRISQDTNHDANTSITQENTPSLIAGNGNRIIGDDVTSIVYNGDVNNNRMSNAFNDVNNNNRISNAFNDVNNNNRISNAFNDVNNNNRISNAFNDVNNNNNRISNAFNDVNNNNNRISNAFNDVNNNRISNGRIDQLRTNRNTRDSSSIICNMSNSEIMAINSEDEEDDGSELSEEIINQKSTLPRNNNNSNNSNNNNNNNNNNNININTNNGNNTNKNIELPPITTSTSVDEPLQSPISINENQFTNSIDSIQVSLDSPSILPAGVNDVGNTSILSPSSPLSNSMVLNSVNLNNLDNQVVLNQLSLPRNANSSFEAATQQTYQLNAQIQQNQQQILKYQNQLQKMQMRNTQIERFYNSIQSPPEKIPYKTVTWYPKWTSRNSPFGDKIIFHVKLNTKNEPTLISTLKKRRNEAKASPDDYSKTFFFCNHLFNSMKYIQEEQSDILNDALKLLKKSVKENSIEACNILAKLYLFGIEGAVYHIPDYDKAGPLFMKVLKSYQQQQKQQLGTEATYNLGLCYENMDSKKKRTQAISFFKFAALNGHPGASFKMYKIYERISPKEAIKWLAFSKRNATKEYPDGLYEYALLSYRGYENGGINKNENFTISLLKEAADKFEHIPSALELGKFFLLTEGPNSTNAAKYLYIAAAKDNKVAQYKLATWWDKQPVKAETRKKAYFDWLVLSAEGKDGLPEAIYRVGVCYEIGYGVTADKKIALSYYENAAARGFAKAKEKLEKLNK
ncbi:hypothetical protein BCR32DRAFT_20132 [Anaeromyces robustus]|uniref:UBA domain-containing protein n=1 Tax=Anaeromyces robustus TaxID=1754192 RepID=A0A1Y1X5L3_9FUNG|nr:hypothetical protein BCR32DRAFT_20132 [Anaeromyces robustus]|eukprot:ORX80604.1 hypothetical protein BCR32DRAFT_20132 [Anaeromyces robustus]